MGPPPPDGDLGSVTTAVSDLSRRVERIEGKLDERTATVMMLAQLEKLFEAKNAATEGKVEAVDKRVSNIEDDGRTRNRLVYGAVVLTLANLVVLLVTIASKGAQ